MEIPGSNMFNDLRRCLIVAGALLAMGCETQPAATPSAPPLSNNNAAETIADEIASLYAGQDGEDHCYLRLERLALEHFTFVMQDVNRYPRTLLAIAHVCDRIVPGEAAAMETAIVKARSMGESTLTTETAQQIAPGLWMNLVNESPNLVAKMREDPN